MLTMEKERFCMGYTHYWYREVEISKEEFERIVEDVMKLEPAWKSKGVKVIVDNDMFYIDGSCETFVFPQIIPGSVKEFYGTMRDGKIFQFCKTNHGTYDVFVQSALIIAKFHLKDKIRVLSDGDDPEWDNARDLVSAYLGYNAHEFRLD